MKTGRSLFQNILSTIWRGAPFLFIILIISCSAGREAREANRIKDFDDLQLLVSERQFEIEHEWMIPLGGGMINMINNPNYIRFKKDSVDLFLPYFGVRQSGGGYGTGSEGIEYQGLPRNLEIIENNEKKTILIKFEGKQGSENLQFFITLFGDGSATTSVSTTQRNSISYRGHARPLSEKKE